uniref:Mannosyl-glycoprotein endo-beta-N-acetylglucosamidase-like domain-containing protein n=1 Tax=Oncorhynchus tshawytscha TaxID=74940 RepID=A0AAZ3SAK8_ONCTS
MVFATKSKHRMVITFLFFFAMNHQGVSASHEMYKGRIISAGQRYGVDPAVLSGIVSRESRGWDRTGQSLRLTNAATVQGGGAWDSREHVDQRHADVGWLLFRCREKKYISSYEQVDAKTTGGNYANDVVARAEYLKKTWLLKVSQAD